MGERAVPLSRFLGPRYWGTWVFVAWLRFSASLPWTMAIKLHKALGGALGSLHAKRRKIVRRNIELCFPNLSNDEIDALASRHFGNVGAMIAEMAFAWFARSDRLGGRFSIEGAEHLTAALAREKGVILYCGHFTPLEICVPPVKALVPLYVAMFRERSNPLLSEIQRRGRARTAHVLVPNDDVRAVLRLLSQNGTLWYAADQARIDSGELLSFFGSPCMVSTAPSRLAKLSGASLVPFFYCRQGDGERYVIRFLAPLDGVPSEDALADTQRLTAVLEQFVRECPDQYLWTHRRFKERKGVKEDVYTCR